MVKGLGDMAIPGKSKSSRNTVNHLKHTSDMFRNKTRGSKYLNSAKYHNLNRFWQLKHIFFLEGVGIWTLTTSTTIIIITITISMTKTITITCTITNGDYYCYYS